MPIDYRIDASSGVVFIDAHGTLTVPECEACSLAIVEDPAYRPDLDYLADGRDVDVDASSAGMQKLVETNLSMSDRVVECRMAYVVSSDLNYGLGRMFAAFSEPSKVEHRVFREMAEARQWLGLPPEDEGSG